MQLSSSPGWHLCDLQVFRMKPGDYPLGSERSRVAARRLLEQRQQGIEHLEVIVCGDSSNPRATEWGSSAKDGRLVRVVSIPAGMTLSDGLRALGGYPERVYANVEQHHPEPVGAGTMLALRW